jgi:hypothetical protein
MQMHLYVSPVFVVCYDNDAMIPEIWAAESVAILQENMVMPRLVHTDFKDEVANFGDVVNTRRPAEHRGRRKVDGDTVTTSATNATLIRVPLDQHVYDSFIIYDGEGNKSFQDLIAMHLRPAVQGLARTIDRGLLGQAHRWFRTTPKRAGRLGSMSSSNSKDFMLEAGEIFNTNRAPIDGRNLVLSPASQTALLKTELFLKANERGDGGDALRRAMLGDILGFSTFMSQTVPGISAINADTVAGTVTNALAAGGSGSQVVDIQDYEMNVGEFFTVAGNDQPVLATAVTASTDTTAVTANEANKYATLAAAVITAYKACAVVGAYSAGYSKDVTVDGYTTDKPPQVGQLIAFGTGGTRHVYTIIEAEAGDPGETKLLLDRPLEFALTNDQLAFPGPVGSFNLAFHRNALAFVHRPMAVPAGANGGVVTQNNISMRVTMDYDSTLMGTRVNVDLLCGYAPLDLDLGVLLLG